MRADRAHHGAVSDGGGVRVLEVPRQLGARRGIDKTAELLQDLVRALRIVLCQCTEDGRLHHLRIGCRRGVLQNIRLSRLAILDLRRLDRARATIRHRVHDRVVGIVGQPRRAGAVHHRCLVDLYPVGVRLLIEMATNLRRLVLQQAPRLFVELQLLRWVLQSVGNLIARLGKRLDGLRASPECIGAPQRIKPLRRGRVGWIAIRQIVGRGLEIVESVVGLDLIKPLLFLLRCGI
ncbi:MAG: hypothetical protein ABI196_00640 [Bradyrhizobium sp.]